jgi:protocatechuate 3,4-dioxygenase alpha subunit
MAELLTTPSQTIGPFFADGLRWKDGAVLFPESAPGRHIRLGGTVVDGAGKTVPDSLLEFWQADSTGRFGGPRESTCSGFGRVMTDREGRYEIRTVIPGQVVGANGMPQAPHVLVVLFARGLLKQVVTRVYFEGESANATDQVLALCGKRAGTLIAARDAADASVFRWNVVLQGGKETVFFET